MGRAATRGDLREFGSQTSALAADDVTLGAMSLGLIQLLAAVRISRNGFGSHASQTANIRRELPSLIGIQGISGRHLRSFNPISDHHEKGFVVGRVAQTGLR